MNKPLLKYFLTREGLTREDVSRALGISLKTVNNKILGHSEFKTSEILAIYKLCKLTPDEVVDIFFE